MKLNSQPVWSVIRMRRSWIFKPLAALMAIVLAPALARMDNPAAPGPLAAQAQSSLPTPTGVCAPLTPNSIIQNNCDPQGEGYGADLYQLENDAVNAYLGAHALPASDAHIIYDYGRTDLRNGVRAYMVLAMLSIVNTPPEKRTQHQKTLYAWLQAQVHYNEVNLYRQALNHWHQLEADPCHFPFDTVIGDAYKINFDGTSFCYNSQSSLFGVPVPSVGYFLAYGLRHSYNAAADVYPDFSGLVADTGINMGPVTGEALAGGAIAAAITGAALGANLAAVQAIFIESGSQAALAADQAFAVSGACVETTGELLGVLAGPVLMVFIAVSIAIIAGLEVFQNQQRIDEVNALQNTLNAVSASTVDLQAFIGDSTPNAMYKLIGTVDTPTIPEMAATGALPAHQTGVDPTFSVVTQGSSSTQYLDNIKYKDWSGNVWTAATRGGWIIRSCQAANGQTCPVFNSISGDIRYQDWVGTQYTASRIGKMWAVTKGQKQGSDVICPANTQTGLSTAADLTKCTSYIASSLQMIDGQGKKITVAITDLASPQFTVTDTLSFSPGTPSVRTITAIGKPTPTVCWNTGVLGSPGFTINDGGDICNTGSLKISYNAPANSATGALTLNATASSVAGSVTRNFPITVATQLAIISPSVVSFTAGQAMNFRVVATGNPTPKLSMKTAVDTTGLTFVDNGDGTGTLSGVYTGFPGSGLCFAGPTCVGFIATNSQGAATQNFTTNVSQPPPAQMSPPASATFVAGVPNQVKLFSSGAITPVYWSNFPFSDAPWLSLHDNGDGTAILSGTPPASTSGTFTEALGPIALGTIGVATNFPVTVTNAPYFTTPSLATFTVGTPGTFNIGATSGSISANQNPPSGLIFAGGNPASISGTPAAGTGGQYTMQFGAIGGTGATLQNLTLNIDEPPSFPGSKLFTAFAGKPVSFTIQALGFPSTSTTIQTGQLTAPTSPSQGKGMYFTITGLPASLAASNFSSIGLATGALTISGTPAVADIGTRKLTVTAQNGVGPAVQQTFTLQIMPPGGVTGPSLVGTNVLTRDANKNVVANVVVSNAGGTDALNVAPVTLKIGSVSAVITPTLIPAIPAGGSGTFYAVFPAASMPASGAGSVLTFGATYTGGSLNSASRIVIP